MNTFPLGVSILHASLIYLGGQKRSALARQLEADGFTVTVALPGQLRELLADDAWSIVVIDDLLSSSVIQAANLTLRSSGAGAERPVLLLADLDDRKTLMAAIASGIDDVLERRTPPQLLVSRIRRWHAREARPSHAQVPNRSRACPGCMLITEESARHCVSCGMPGPASRWPHVSQTHYRWLGLSTGRYQLVQGLCRDRSVDTYKAYDRRLRADVIVKAITLGRNFTDSDLLRDVHLLANLSHPGVIRVMDTFSLVPTVRAVVLALAGGEPLESLVREHGSLPLGVAAELIRQAAQSIGAARSLGQFRGALTPSNICVQFQGAGRVVATIQDPWGADREDPNARTPFVGGPLIRAQVLGAPHSPESVDLSMGLDRVLYYALVGRVMPHERSTARSHLKESMALPARSATSRHLLHVFDVVGGDSQPEVITEALEGLMRAAYAEGNAWVRYAGVHNARRHADHPWFIGERRATWPGGTYEHAQHERDWPRTESRLDRLDYSESPDPTFQDFDVSESLPTTEEHVTNPFSEAPTTDAHHHELEDEPLLTALTAGLDVELDGEARWDQTEALIRAFLDGE